MTQERTVRWLLLLAGTGIILAAIWLYASPARQEPERKIVTIPASPAAPRPTTEAAAPPPAKAVAQPVTQPPFVPSPDVLSALKLKPSAVFRDPKGFDADDGVTCGEVANSPNENFRRFVYIASAKTGFVDDGGALFRQVAETACKRR